MSPDGKTLEYLKWTQFEEDYQLLWNKFKQECTIVSKIPLLNLYAFQHFMAGYIEAKTFSILISR